MLNRGIPKYTALICLPNEDDLMKIGKVKGSILTEPLHKKTLKKFPKKIEDFDIIYKKFKKYENFKKNDWICHFWTI